MDNEDGGYQVTRLEHSLQAATRAHRAGEDEETVVCALLHDIGDYLAPANHSEVAAAMLRPYVSERNYWIIKHHGVFQGVYYFQHIGADPNARDQWRDHPYFHDTVVFCAEYDQVSFDPDYRWEPLSSSSRWSAGCWQSRDATRAQRARHDHQPADPRCCPT